MKKVLLSLSVIMLLLTSCKKEDEGIPESLEDKRSYLKEKQTELSQLKSLIDTIESEILALDPSSGESEKLVTAEKVMRRDLIHYVDIQGNVDIKDHANASSETGGRIVGVYVKEGQYISRGALVAKIDLEAVNKQIAEVNTSLGLANDAYERQKRLWDQKIGTEMQYLQAKNNVERLEKTLETLRFQLTKSSVYSPISGEVDMTLKEAGEFCGPGEPIVRIINTSSYLVKIDVPENYLGTVKRGQIVQIEFPALEKELDAKISRIGTSIHPTSRTFEVEIELSNKAKDLKPNLLAIMKLDDDRVENTHVLPVDVIQQEISGKDYVFVVVNDEDGQARADKRIIETGLSYDGEIAVLGGLEDVDMIIYKGSLSVSSNDAIKITKSEDE